LDRHYREHTNEKINKNNNIPSQKMVDWTVRIELLKAVAIETCPRYTWERGNESFTKHTFLAHSLLGRYLE